MHVRTTLISGILTASIVAPIGRGSAQPGAQGQPSQPPMTVYVQISDARFDSYLRVKKALSIGQPDTPEEFFYIPPPTSKERERELADWRRRFRLIVSAATLSEGVQSKISQIQEEFRKAERAAECWAVDHNRERRITITMIGSSSETAIRSEYRAASRDFSANPNSFTCKYMYKVDPTAPAP